MPATAFALALAAAFLHAFWNILVARARDSEAATAVALITSVVVFAPVAVLVWDMESSVWPFLVGTASFHLLYYVLLAAAYRRAELSVVYPLARGLAPVFVLAFGVAVLAAQTSGQQAAGVCLVGGGVVLVRGIQRRAGGTGVLFGIAIAACIAAYTLIDNEGVRRANPIAYLEVATAFAAIAYTAGAAVAKGGAALRAELNLFSVGAGIAMFGGYALVLAALQLAAAAPVAAVRETSILIATAGAAVVLKERFGPVRVAGASLIVTGTALLAL